jgi:exonuclease III
VCCFNAQALGQSRKRSAINTFIADNDIDVMLLTETWLHSAGDEVKLMDLASPGYSVQGFARDSLGVAGRGGGIALVIKDSLKKHACFSQSPLSHPSFEAGVLSVTVNSVRINIACIYRPPPSKKNMLTHSMFFEQFQDFLEHCDTLPGKTLLMGDFNIHVDDVNDPNAKKLFTLLDMFCFSQSVVGSTHKLGHTLDLILYRSSDDVLSTSFVNSDLKSDHSAVMCRLNVPKPAPEPVVIMYRSISKIDKQAFRDDLSMAVSPDCSVVEYNALLKSVLDTHAPLRQRTLRPRKFNPWFSGIAEQFGTLKRERRQAERRWLKSRLTVHKEIFESIKHRISDLVDSAKTSFFSAQILATSTCKELFRTFNSLLGRQTDSPLPTTHDPETLPTVFSDYFSDKIANIRNSFPSLDPATLPVTSAFSGTFLDCFTPVSEQFVLNILKNTAPKSCELDPIPTKLLYDNLDTLLPTVTQIINTSLVSGSVPADLKTAVVKPLLKKPSLDRNELKNFRPVSNLPFLSKILEKVVLCQLLSHLDSNNLCNPFQSAYRAGRSTETVLLRVVNDILSALDEDKLSILLLLDNSAAFDTIDHSILLSRLETVFGIRFTALQWFSSYLQNRTQYVSVNNSSSDPSPLVFGVPQGSVLGPVLFIMYTTPLSSIIQQHAVNHQLFADDTQLQQSCKPADIHSTTQILQKCTTDIKSWMTTNMLKLNDDKTEALLFTGSTSADFSLPASITVGSSDIYFSDSARNLGFIMDSALTMKQHITKVCQVCYFELKRISSIRKFLSEDATKTLVTSCILSRLDYCNSLLIGCPDSTLYPLQKVQNSAARLIYGVNHRQPSTPLLVKLHWLPVSERIKYKTASICFNIVTGSAPSYLSDLVSLYTPSRSLRSSTDSRLLRQSRYNRKSHGFRSFSFYGPQLWNYLPFQIRHSSSSESFKSSLKTYLFSGIFKEYL